MQRFTFSWKWLVVLAFILYLPSFQNDFFWDDYVFFVDNIYTTSWQYFPEIFTQSTTSGAGAISNYYRPLTSLSFLMDRTLWGLSPFGFHLTNTFLHAGVGVLIFLILQKLTFGRLSSWFVAVLFLIHPIQPEAVAYINSRGDSLYTFFMVLGLFTLVSFISTTKEKVLLAVLPAITLASLLSKELAISSAGVYGLGWFITWIQSKKDFKNFITKTRFTLMGIGASLITTLGYIFVRFRYLNFLDSFDFSSVDPAYAESMFVRLFTFGKIFFVYIQTLIVPYNLHYIRSTEIPVTITSWFIGMLFMIIGVYCLSFWEWRSKKSVWIGFGWSWFLGTLVPVSGIVALNQPLLHHWLYLPSMGFFIVVVRIAQLFVAPYVSKQRIQAGVVVSVGALSYLSYQQIQLWGSPIDFYEQNLQYVSSPQLSINLCGEYADLQQYEKAIEHCDAARESKEPFTFYKSGLVYQDAKRWSEAEAILQEGITLYPDYQLNYQAIINLYEQQDRYQEALEYAQTLSTYYPKDWQVWYKIGQLAEKLGDKVESENAFKISDALK